MGRYVSPQLTSSNLTDDFTDTVSTFDAEGYITSYTANNIAYSNITYTNNEGSASQFGGVYKVVTGWTETININNSTQTVSVNYDNVTGRVSSLTIT